MQRLNPNTTVYPKMIKLDFPLIPISSATAAGAYSIVINIIAAASMIANYANLAAVFDEVCIVGARFELRLDVTANPAGSVWAYVDEKVAAAPTLANSQNKARLDMAAFGNESPNRYTLLWKARDYTDLIWEPTGSATASAYLKIFASNAGTGTNAAGGINLLVTGSVALCFRGYQ
jgi:hypothetical protein